VTGVRTGRRGDGDLQAARRGRRSGERDGRRFRDLLPTATLAIGASCITDALAQQQAMAGDYGAQA